MKVGLILECAFICPILQNGLFVEIGSVADFTQIPKRTVAQRRGALDSRLPELGRLTFAVGLEQYNELISNKFHSIEGLNRNLCSRVLTNRRLVS